MKGILYLIKRFLLRRPFMVATEKRFQCQFRFKSPDCVGRTIYKKKDYEPALTKYILDHLNFADGEIFLDIGANIGWYSVMLARKFGSSLKVFAFEPDNFNFSLLSENLKRNQVSNVTAVNLAVAEESCDKTLYLYKEGNLGRHSLLPTEGLETQTVRTTTLDQFVKEHNLAPEKVKFIKMDVEGYEYFAMQGAKDLLKTVPLVLTEYSPEMMKERGYDPSEFLKFMESFSYQPYQIMDNVLSPIKISDHIHSKDAVSDIFWMKNPN